MMRMMDKNRVLTIPCIFLSLFVVVSFTFSNDEKTEVEGQVSEGFLALSEIKLPAEGLDGHEKTVVQALSNIVNILTKSKNVDEVLNKCDPYSEIVFGADPSLLIPVLMRFSGLSFRDRSVVEKRKIPSEIQKNNDEYILLFNGNGFIEIVRQTCSEERNGLWKEGDVVSLRKLDFRNKTAILLEFNNDGILSKLSYEKYDFDSEKFYMTVYATLIGVSPTVQEYYPSKTVTKIKTWNRDGTFNKEENYEERGE